MILTKNYLRGIAEQRNLSFSTYSQQRILNENTQIFKSKTTYDIFLSHSYLDKTLVYALVELFNKSGYSVYVDWMVDTQLDRDQVNKKTSEILRKRMNASRGLAYISTSNTAQSKWCPWELGYQDGKTHGRCAILPVLDSSVYSFRGQEYLGLYPYLKYIQKANSLEYDFWVYDSERTEDYVILSSWLNGYNPTKH